MEHHDKRQQWLDEAAMMRARLAAPGVASREDLRTRSGIAFLGAIGNGTLPPAPIAELLGITPITVAPGLTVFHGFANAGALQPERRGAWRLWRLAARYRGRVRHPHLAAGRAGKGYTTLELKVNYIRAMTDQTGPVRPEGKVVNLGGQVGIAEGRITDANGKLYAFATTTCLVFDIARH